MKRYIRLSLSLMVFLSSILFLDKSISIIITFFLIAYLELEDIRFSFLPLSIALIYKDQYSICLIVIYILMFLTFFKRKNNKYYFLFRIIIILFLLNIIIYALDLYSLNVLYCSLIIYLLYGILLLFYHVNGKTIVALNDNITLLTIILFYMILFTYYQINLKIILFLFMLLYLIDDNKYKIFFTFIYVCLSFYFNQTIDIKQISVFASSYLPLIGLIYLKYNSYIDILLAIYIIVIFLAKYFNKKIKIENNFNDQFKGFKEYLVNISIEEEKLKFEENIKLNRLETIMTRYCNNCVKNTMCNKKLDIRYMYVLNGIKGGINYYNCPHFNEFKIANYPHAQLSIKEHNVISYLVDELEYIYNMNIKNSNLYNKLFNELIFYGYYPIDINVYYSIATTFFMIKFTKNKTIIRQLLGKISSKIFKEILDIKIIDKDECYNVYFYKKVRCHIEYSKTLLAKNNNIVSGDNYYIKKDYNDSYIFALSDGMGSGHDAYIESSRTLEMIKKLSLNHFSIKSTLRLLEEIEGLRCDYDSYATLDLLYLNTSIMKAYLYKMGSTVSYIYHNKEFISYQNRALPLKLDDINSFYEIELNIGDMVFLLSDGISDFISDNEIKKLIDERSTDVTLERIINKIKEKYNNNLCDDLSLIIIKIIE